MAGFVAVVTVALFVVVMVGFGVVAVAVRREDRGFTWWARRPTGCPGPLGG